MLTIQEFINSDITWDEHFMYDSEGNVLMSDLEIPVMEKTAEILCQGGGDIINFGYGLGIFDNYVEQYTGITSHTIVELHPQIYQRAISDGWNESNLIFGEAKNVLDELITTGATYDGVFIDLFSYPSIYTNGVAISSGNDLMSLMKTIHNIVKPGGKVIWYTLTDSLVELKWIAEKSGNIFEDGHFTFSYECISFSIDENLLEGKFVRGKPYTVRNIDH